MGKEGVPLIANFPPPSGLSKDQKYLLNNDKKLRRPRLKNATSLSPTG